MGFKGRLIRVRTGTLDEIEDAFAFHVEELVGNPVAAQRIAQAWRRKSRAPCPSICASTPTA